MALRVSIIEFKSLGSNTVSFQRFSDFITFERLSNVRLQDIQWARWWPERGINGLRANAVKVAVLNLAVIPPQRGGLAITKLINRLFQQDISLVLTPIQPTWGDDFGWNNVFKVSYLVSPLQYDSDIYQELEKMSSGSRHFLNEGGFPDYIVDYQKVAVPRLAEHAELHRPNLLRITEMPTDNNTRSAAIAALFILLNFVSRTKPCCNWTVREGLTGPH